ncbi:MAG: DUF2231 domain-containing protein [Myxococcota bacterium]|nr:DUF2231 domain-containing protein [Myxococcota bacterium]
MKARARFFGHPIHQMLIPIPFGLFVTGILLDVVARVVDLDALTIVSFWNLTIGVGTGVLAAIFGLIDYTAIPKRTRARRIGAVHGIGNAIVIALLAGALWQRADMRFFGVPDLAFGLEIAALVLAGVTGWLGGELVDRLGIGVEPDAHPDAPSSLGKHAHEKPRTTLPYGASRA